jgi:hypothetical protein
VDGVGAHAKTLRRKGRECVVLGGWCRGSRKDAETQRGECGWIVDGVG